MLHVVSITAIMATLSIFHYLNPIRLACIFLVILTGSKRTGFICCHPATEVEGGCDVPAPGQGAAPPVGVHVATTLLPRLLSLLAWSVTSLHSTTYSCVSCP